MTYIKVEACHTEDERWLLAGADAFAVHVAALVYCDRQLTDGRISPAMAGRVSLAVPPDRAGAAVEALLEHGFWAVDGGLFLIDRYEEYGFPAEQIRRTRGRWAEDKRRRQQHQVGDHSLCKDPKFCPSLYTSSTVESGVDSEGESRPHTKPNQTKPSRRDGFGNGGAAHAAAPKGSRRAAARGKAAPPLPSGFTFTMPEVS